MSTAPHYIGVDVGTGSVRAAIFDANGNLVAQASRDISLYRDMPNHAEQSSAEIWRAVCASIHAIMNESGLNKQSISGVGFDATCSLVVIGPQDTCLAVGAHDNSDHDVIVWMDHRAGEQTDRINATSHQILTYVGGTISPEMETPKLMWLKENLRATFDGAAHFFDLTDFLTWKATGSLARSVCTLSCKWTYLAHEQAWDASYFHQIGLGDLADEGFVRIGTEIVSPGTKLAQGLTATAAAELGLPTGTPVGAGLIDAHSGGVSAIGAGGAIETNLVYVFGTSACTMANSHDPIYVPGVWGPYYSAMVPGLWLNEGGQSSAGAAIDQLLLLHPVAPDARRQAETDGSSLPDYLLMLTCRAAPSLSQTAELAGSLLVVPEFLGNRAPKADPAARAIIAGLGIKNNLDSLVALYIAGLTGIGYGLRQIIAASTAAGATIETVTLIGGAGREPLAAQLLADCTGLAVIRPKQSESVLLGAAILGAVASGAKPDINSAVTAMSGNSDIFQPISGQIADLHAHRFQIFEALQSAARSAKYTIGENHGHTQA